MNETFSTQRFLLLLKKEWTENRRQYILSVIALFLLLNIILLLQVYLRGNRVYSPDNFLLIALTVLCVLGTTYAITTFQKYRARESAVFELGIPASAAEKLFLELVKNVLVFNLTLILLFKATDALYTWIATNQLASIGYVAPGKDYQERQLGLFAPFLAVQGWFIYCSLQFRKQTYLIAIIVTAVTITLLMKFANTIPTFWKIPNWSFSNPDFQKTYISMASKTDPYIENSFLINLLRAFYMFGWGPLFYWATYFKLKETQAK
ncbi:hypothetical protein [Niabella drilacis]|uniref:ABC-2 family transporter protein n=1 Tax=Niabella drilacis (strain DSM 25811 / CCM 8410 / CCUG 62505 / LMG 26954 / E90) TaxID=1285928 RepID=A0A1G6PYK7_NIADE|nr:hypothetical protein [Niabella drilacis]SDC85051.1 hypothetical protein SAMN04487894_104207 [Niabella drilacis]